MLRAISTTAQDATPRAVQNIETFGRLYGYVRYFHPSDEAAAVDWDKLAILGCQRVESAHTDAELQTMLLALFKPVAPTLQLVNAGKNVRFQAKQITPPKLAGYRTVSWQHQGMGQPTARGPYYSRRINRPAGARTAGFGTVIKSLDAAAYRGKEFRYSAMVRNRQPERGLGALWARVDLPNRKTGFFDNMNDRPIADSGWKEYRLTGTVDPQAVSLVFGAMLQGQGQVQVDDMRVEVRDNGTWQTVFATGFEDDPTDQYPRSLSDKPGAGSANPAYSFAVSDAEAAAGRRSVLISSTKAQPEAPASPGNDMLFAEHAKVGEVVQEDIGSNLRCVLPLALYGTRTATFPAADSVALARLQAELGGLSAADLQGKNRAVRLADVVITWNVFQHFYPYFAVTNSNWPTALPEALRMAYPEQSAQEFLGTLRRLTARLHDGHVRVHLSSGTAFLFRLPVEWEWVQQQLVVTRVLGDSVPVQRGDVIKTINGQPADAYFRTAEQYISAATPGWLRYRAARETTTGLAGTAVQLQVQNAAGALRAVTLRHSVAPTNHTSTAAQPAARRISPTVYYLNLDQLPMDSINALLPELARAKAIICDLRGYPKNNHELLAHLLPRPDTARHWMRVPRYLYPNQQKLAGYAYMGWQMQPKAPHLAARIIFITDGSAISYAESFMGMVEGYQLATIIGQPTAGTNGNVNPFVLPGRYSISWTGMEVRKHDGRQHHGVGITPDIYLEKTLQGVREGRDEFLEKAIELANER
ncbi:S41 family peptidase [Hymenobacter puniceus]|uniref:S41 family peptidase n=1 Tax=Hymenobacter sp. BT190 TaxID=2763505 RepID=UPI001650F785|nr:S41 family peptidase [Hymenobacter sp. BT190]MBC6700375.1 peptidase S41 [Hymenobacter sp. BT190]